MTKAQQTLKQEAATTIQKNWRGVLSRLTNQQLEQLLLQDQQQTWPKTVSWNYLDHFGYFEDEHGATSITEICPDNEDAQDFDLNKNGLFSAVFKGRKGLNKLSSQLATANNYYSKSEYPIVSFAKVRDVEEDGATEDIYSVALKTKHGITQSFVDDRAFNEAQRTYEDEYEIGLLAFACRKILENKIRATTNEDELNQALEGSLDTATATNDDLKNLNQLSWFLKTPLNRESNEGVLEPEDWLEQKKNLDEKVKEIADKIDKDNSISSNPLQVYNSGKRDPEKKYFKNPKKNEETDQNAEADKAARKFSTHSASRIIGNRAEERIKLNAAEVDLSKQEAEEIAEKFLNEKYGSVDKEKLIPKITETKDGTFWGEKTVTRNRTDTEKETWKEDFKKEYESLLKQQIPDVASTNSSSVHRPRNRNDIATVLFDGNPANNRMFLSLKGTDKYVMAEQCKSESIINGKYFVHTFEDGKPIRKEFLESQIGKVIIPKNTIFTLNKETGEYEPQNAMDLIKPNLPNPAKAQYEFEIYKDFKLKAISSVDGKRNMATLFQGEVEAEFDLPRKISKGLDENGILNPITFNDISHLGKKYNIAFNSIAAKGSNPQIDILGKFTVSGNGLELESELSKDLFIELDGGEKTKEYLKNLKSGTSALELKDPEDKTIDTASLTAGKIQIKLTEELYNKINEDKGQASESFEELKKRVNNTAVVFQMDNSRFQHKTGEEVKEESLLGKYNNKKNLGPNNLGR